MNKKGKPKLLSMTTLKEMANVWNMREYNARDWGVSLFSSILSYCNSFCIGLFLYKVWPLLQVAGAKVSAASSAAFAIITNA